MNEVNYKKLKILRNGFEIKESQFFQSSDLNNLSFFLCFPSAKKKEIEKETNEIKKYKGVSNILII